MFSARSVASIDSARTRHKLGWRPVRHVLAGCLTRKANRVGALFYGNIDTVIPPRSVRSHFAAPLPDARETRPHSIRRNHLRISAGRSRLAQAIAVFIVSDFISTTGWARRRAHAGVRIIGTSLRPLEMDARLGLLTVRTRAGDPFRSTPHDARPQRFAKRARRERECARVRRPEWPRRASDR